MKYLVGDGMVRGGGTAQYGGFLGLLASIGVPIAIDLISKLFGKGMACKTGVMAAVFITTTSSPSET